LLTHIIAGNWGTWTAWGTCSLTCGGGSQSRSRLCNSPAPANGGAACAGSSTEAQTCNTQGCPVGEIFKAKMFHWYLLKWIIRKLLFTKIFFPILKDCKVSQNSPII